MGVLGYSTTAASNTTALTGVGSLAEGVMPIKQINDAIRQELADIAQLYGDVVAGITTTGTASAYVVATASGHSAYNNQMALRLRFHVDCAGGATTVNVNVLGTKALKVFDTTGARDPAAGEIKADMVYDCIYVAALNCMVVTAHTNNFAGLTAAIAAKQDKDDDLTAIAGLGGTGLAVRTAANTWAQRQIVSADGSVTITNPAGVAGDIGLSVPGLAASSPVTLSGAPPQAIVTGLTGTPSYVELWFNGVSLTSTGNLFIQLGDSGGYVTTGYESSSQFNGSGQNAVAGFIIVTSSASRAFTGSMILRRTPGTNIWIATHNGCSDGGASYINGGGKVTLTGSLTQIRISASGGNDFDNSGTVYAAYR